MNEIQTSIQQFLAQTHPFNELSPDEQEKLTRQLTPFRYQMGQPILVRDKPLHQVSIIYEGRVRYLGYEPGQKTNLPLALLQPGAMIGWVNFVRGIACETAIASTDVVCLTFTYQEFSQLLNRVNTLKTLYQEQCSLVEVFDILAHQMEQKAQVNDNLKQIALDITEKGKSYHLPPGKYKLENELISPLKQKDTIWFVSGGEIPNFPITSELKLTPDDNNLEIKGLNPARLIGFPAAEWHKIFHSLALTPAP
jgi:ATP-binding cassette, subfamily B, bacterial HlyB/CyaB